jgi:hypothetical protein
VIATNQWQSHCLANPLIAAVHTSCSTNTDFTLTAVQP